MKQVLRPRREGRSVSWTGRRDSPARRGSAGPSYLALLLILLVGLAGLPVAYVAPSSVQRAEVTNGATTATSYSTSTPALTSASLVPSTMTTAAQTSLLATSTDASGPTGRVRLIVRTTSASVKAQVASQGCEIVHELINATAVACPPDVKVPNSEPDGILHILDLQSDGQIRADQVWALGYTGSGVTVAVLDTGVDLTHPELTASIVGGKSFVDYTTSYDDDHGHGTHVSGIITSDGIDEPNSKGAAYNAQIWMAKICDASGLCYTSDMVAAIQYVVTNHKAKVMSISIGGGGTSSSNCDGDYLASQINWAYNNGIVSAVAAGNYPDETIDPQNIVRSPACASKAIAVAAVDSSDNRASFSRYGNALLDHGVAAPGVNIYSAYPGGYAWMSGTSMATPHVSATIALMLQKNPNLSQAAIRSMILNSADCLGRKYGSCPNIYIGYGRVDALSAQLADDAVITGNDIPTTMTAGQTYTVHVTAENVGTTTWTATAGYKLGAVGDSDPFAPTRVLLDPSDSIAPGQSKTFTFTMTAPSKAGSYVTDWRMVREFVAWFGSTAAVTVTVNAGPQPVNDAAITGNDVPTTMNAGQAYTVHVTVQNMGTTTWTAAAGYKLGAVGDSDPFAPTRVLLDPSDSIWPGQSKTFTFTMTAPSTARSYVTDWRMVRELVAWFGQTLAVTVSVSAGPQLVNDAVITGNDIPATMTAGQSYTVHITVQNTGTTTWTASANYKLGAVGDSDPFAPNRILLDAGDSIGPGQSKTFTFTMTAPSTPRSYVTDWRMVRELVAWFGATLTVQVTVQAAAGQYGAVVTANDMPTSMIAGQTYTVHVTVQNTGTNTWTAADGYKLGAAGDVNPFGPTRVLLDPSDSITTGQSKTFTFTVTAPSAAGTYTVTWRMVRELVTWFGSSSKVSVSVSSGVRNAAIVSNDMPTTMVLGQTYTVHITVQNTGTTTWTAASNYKLGFVGDRPAFGPPRILLDSSASVAPGQQYTFTFTITAPSTTGTYTMQYRMLQEFVTWFGQTTTTTITVQ